MADKKISQLAPKNTVDQLPTDIYESSDETGSTPSKKESRAQMTTYFNAHLQLGSSAQVTGLDAKLATKANTDGSNATGTWPIDITGTAIPRGPSGGDLTGFYPSPSLRNVNSNIGTFGDATHAAQFTVNAKGLITQAAQFEIEGALPTLDQGQLIIGITDENPVAGRLVSSDGTVDFDVSTNGEIDLSVSTEALPELEQGQLIIGTNDVNEPIAGNIVSTNGSINVDVSSLGEIDITVIPPTFPALGQGQLIIGVEGEDPVAGDLESPDDSITFDTSTPGKIFATVNGGGTGSLQDAYDIGNTVEVGEDKPFRVFTISSNFQITNGADGDAAYCKVETTSLGAIPAPVMTDAQFKAIAAPYEALEGWVTDSHEKIYYANDLYKYTTPMGRHEVSSNRVITANNEYILQGSSIIITLVMSTTGYPVGSKIKIYGTNNGGWRVNLNPGQRIVIANNSTNGGTTSSGGYIFSGTYTLSTYFPYKYTVTELVCIAENLTWIVSSTTGTLFFA